MSRTLLLAAAIAAFAATTMSTPAGANPSTAPRKTLTAFAGVASADGPNVDGGTTTGTGGVAFTPAPRPGRARRRR